jgi:amino acid transporter
MTPPRPASIGTLSALSIGLGGMVGGGIFAVTGLTVQLTRGAAPLAFVVAGVVALLTAWSYWRLTLRFPSSGGTVEFLNRAYGPGPVTGALNILLCLSYVILLSVYAYAFGAYGAHLVARGPAQYEAWQRALSSGVVVALAAVNYLGAALVVRSENFFNASKMALLAIFVVAGLATPLDWSRMGPHEWVGPVELVAGAMMIFLNYEGFELIANASSEIRNPRRALPIAYLGGVAIAIALYVAIAAVVVGHLDFPSIARHSDVVLSTAAEGFLGSAGGAMVVAAALLATSSAINATLYGSGRLAYLIARSGELPASLERSIHGQPLEGMIGFAVLTLLAVHFLPLSAIATMGSAGFLLIFFAVNVANVRLAADTGGHRWVSALAALTCAIAFAALCGNTWSDPARRWHLWVLAGLIAGSVAIELVYRLATGRVMRVHERRRPAHRAQS